MSFETGVHEDSTAPATAQTRPEAATDAYDEQWEEVGPSLLSVSLRTVPAWLISLLVHMALLIMLAFYTFSLPLEEEGMFVASGQVEEAEEMLEEFTEIEVESLEELEELQEDMAVSADMLEPGDLAFGDFASVADVEPNSDIGDISLPSTTIDEIGSLFGDDGEAFVDIAGGLKAAATFFGTQTRGQRFVFVVDNSNSMTKGRFETAVIELLRTVGSLSERQSFYVIFFSDTAYRLFHPNPAPGMVAATETNKEKLKAWLYSVEMCLQTRGEEAMQVALSLNPDVIYILGDGAFTDKTANLLTAPHNRSVPIHTLGMEVDGKGEQQLMAIAQANNGTYRLVAASPMAKQMAAQNPIPRNNTRGPVWGLKLGDQARHRKKGKKK